MLGRSGLSLTQVPTGAAPSMSFRVQQHNTAHGPLQVGFTFDLEDGYSVLAGKNQSGKSSILQLSDDLT
jgi:hypothetical protein